MKIQILGTAASEGWPAIFCSCPACEKARALGGKNLRMRSGTLIDDCILIDLSPDLLASVLRFGVKPNRVHSLFVTHDHEDHFAPETLTCRYGKLGYLMHGEPEILCVYGNDRVVMKTRAVMDKSAAEKPRVACKPIRPFACVTVSGGYRVTALPALHDRRQQCSLYLVEDAAGKRMLYGHDTGIFTEDVFDFLNGIHLDFVMLDCNAGSERDGANHMGFLDDLVVRDRLICTNSINADTVLVITHFSHNCRMTHEELERMAGPEGFLVAYDGIEFVI